VQWSSRPRPARAPLEGRYCRLEPLEPRRHGEQLFEASMGAGAEERFRYLFEAPQSRPDFERWLTRSAASEDPLYFAVIDSANGRCEGRQALMRIVPEHGVIEIGSILWGPAIARTRVATEALFLFARHAFDDLGYRRFEWKCNALNEPSRRAATRFGFTFEGIFRQHMMVKGESRDTAWFSIIDKEWPALRQVFERWLDPANFDHKGRQRKRMVDCRKGA
jgi:RimJ/RimL family protein N-acetyltransferase